MEYGKRINVHGCMKYKCPTCGKTSVICLEVGVKDYAVVTQSIGRIARTFEGKADPIAYDFVDNMGYTVKVYKKRSLTYRKNGCYFIEKGLR